MMGDESAKDKKSQIHPGAWFPWLLLHMYMSWLLLQGGGARGGVIHVFYLLVSFAIGLAVCYRFRKSRINMIVAGTLLFGGPFFTAKYIQLGNHILMKKRDVAMEEVARLCEQYGGKKIYETVEGVESVFQVRAKREDFYAQLQDQYGMDDPWNTSLGDQTRMTYLLGIKGDGYFHLEQQTAFGKEGPPYLRTSLKYEGPPKGSKRGPLDEVFRRDYVYVKEEVKELRSEYGWVTIDLTTDAMRERWISGGTTKILNLSTGVVLAERTGFFLASGPLSKLSWASGRNRVDCNNSSNIRNFLVEVLSPPNTLP
tara:strand:- start:115884 stop:116819 length:936 start_codon:yes stop_codon:yes gene_type:complete